MIIIVRKCISPVFVAVAVLSCSFTLGIAQVAIKDTDLPNFDKVSETLYRGGQPKSGGLQKLTQLGVKTVVNLRDDDERARAEEVEAVAAGLRYFNVPFDNFGRPSDAKIEKVLAIIDTPENQPVFVHCKRGADRTGTVVAVYRIVRDGWTSERAKSEANQHGMSILEVGMKDYIHDYYQRRLLPKNPQIKNKGNPLASLSAFECAHEYGLPPFRAVQPPRRFSNRPSIEDSVMNDSQLSSFRDERTAPLSSRLAGLPRSSKPR